MRPISLSSSVALSKLRVMATQNTPPAWRFVSFNETEVEQVPERDGADAPVDREELRRCLESLSPEHREALLLRFFEDMSYEEIARVTDSGLGTVRSRIHYGKQALKKAWEGITP